MSVRDVVRCSGITGKGNRCARYTARTPYCYQHLEEKEHLQVKESGIPNAGLGLFTTIKREPGDTVAPYTGKVVHPRGDYINPYGLLVKKHPLTIIDARVSTTEAGRYANSYKPGQGKNNARLSYNANKKQASIKATCTIKPEQEVFTEYGKLFWTKKKI